MTYSAMYGGRSGRAKGKAPKSKKLKCILCQGKGHDATSCPQLTDDQKKEQVLKATLMQPTLGFGKTHKTSRKAGTILNTAIGNGHNIDDSTENNNSNNNNIFEMFRATTADDSEYEPLIVLDGGCDIGATIDHIATTITNSNQKKAKVTYQTAIKTTMMDQTTDCNNDDTNQETTDQSTNNNNNSIFYGASICRYFIKPPDHHNNNNRNKKNLLDNPRITTILETNPHTYFVIGLGPGFFMNEHDDINSNTNNNDYEESEDYKEAVDALVEAIEQQNDYGEPNDDSRIVGLYGKLDYSSEMMDMIGYDVTTQINKLRATCQVAIQFQLPIQIKIHPPAVPPNYNMGVIVLDETTSKVPEEFDEATIQQANAYKQVVKDLAKVLLEMTPTVDDSNNAKTDQSQLNVHLSSWSGTEIHMNHLLQAFPNNLYIGFNATIGYTKHKHLHECAFAIPIDRCILESDAPNAIPSQLHNKKKTFCHSGCILHSAVSIAEHKPQLSPGVVLRSTTQNTLQLYGGGNRNCKNQLFIRMEEVKRRALEQQRNEQFDRLPDDEDDKQEGNDKTCDETTTVPSSSSNQLSKKKNKKKIGANNPAATNSDSLIDEDALLTELAAEMLNIR